MKVTADTNVLVRAVTGDDAKQSPTAQMALERADIVVITLPALCELVWVLSGSYKISKPDIAETIRRLIGGSNVLVDRPAVDAGLDMLDAGADFADGVIAFEGHWLGADTFLSFDKAATKRLKTQGQRVHLLR